MLQHDPSLSRQHFAAAADVGRLQAYKAAIHRAVQAKRAAGGWAAAEPDIASKSVTLAAWDLNLFTLKTFKQPRAAVIFCLVAYTPCY
jgi:hypothetical protein